MPNMVIAVTPDAERFQQVIDTWEGAGVAGVTILESLGVHKLRQAAARDDLPLMPTLARLLQAAEYHHRTLFAVLDDGFDLEGLIRATEQATGGDYSAPDTGILFVVPVTRVLGLRCVPGQASQPGGKDTR